MSEQLTHKDFKYSPAGVKEWVDEVRIHSALPTPLIGISSNHHEDNILLRETYVRSVIHCNGVPIIIPQSSDTAAVVEAVRRCDAIILTGGSDVHPAWFGSEPNANLGFVDSRKDYFDFTVLYAALRYSLPLLGVCRGEQIQAIAMGGSLVQDIPTQIKGYLNHMQSADKHEVWHSVTLTGEGRLPDIIRGESTFMVNSFHHQCVKDLPPGCKVTALSQDGVVEGIDFYPEYPFMGVQWHPETLAFNDIEPHKSIINFIVREGDLYRRARSFHTRHLTLDSHVDTPMIFSGLKGYDFMARSRQALVDLPKMLDGGLDTVCMVAYIPQGELSEEGHAKAYEYTIQTLRSIDEVMSRTGDLVRIAERPREIFRNKREGRLTIIKGIENGYALADKIERVKEFQEMGVRYITLCHNGDNLLCDSAMKSHHTHGGLSDLGKRMVAEMNRVGVIPDVSHCGSETIRDVLATSKSPVIASHSSCRALCDHPRNLTDEEIKGIAETGGVVQICMYAGFVREYAQEATVVDFVDHVCHAVDLVGADHVGIGTDFDGDGGVIGCRDASQVVRITIELMRRGLSNRDIAKIWGENFLRVLEMTKELSECDK